MLVVDEDKIKAAFSDFNKGVATIPASEDRIVNLIVKFIKEFGNSFSEEEYVISNKTN